MLFRELEALGYEGGLTTLKLHLMKLKPAQRVEPLIRFETELGWQMQVDFASIRRGPERLSAFIATQSDFSSQGGRISIGSAPRPTVRLRRLLV